MPVGSLVVDQTIKEWRGLYLVSAGSVILGRCNSSIDKYLLSLWRICSPLVFGAKQSSLLELLVATSEVARSYEKAAHIYQSIRRNIAEHFFIVAPCILIYVEFTHQQMHFFILKKHIKIYIKIHINIAPTCFGLRSSSGSLH